MTSDEILGVIQVLKEIGTMPEEVTLVFGHTHKPFQKDMKDFTGYPRWVNVYNTGGWVVETVFPEPVHGAAVVLVDEELNATSLRMYNVTSIGHRLRVLTIPTMHGP